MIVINEIDISKLDFDLTFADLSALVDNTVVYRQHCDCFMIVVPGGFLSYIDNNFRFRTVHDFTPWTKKYESFAIVDTTMIVRN